MPSLVPNPASPAPAAAHGAVPRLTLWLRAVMAVAGLVTLTTAVLFFGIDHFVALRFSSLREGRLKQVVTQTQRAVAGQFTELASIATMLANDRDLVNSTYYHLRRGGGRVLPQETFHLKSVTLWDAGDHLIAEAGRDGPVPLMFPHAGQKVRVKLAWIGGKVWLVAVAALRRDGDFLAHIQLARPLLPLLHHVAWGATIQLAGTGPPPPGMVRASIAPNANPPIALDVTTPDEAKLALASIKQVLAPVMAVSGLLLVVGIAIFLRRLLRPIQDLIRAAGAVGRGEFGLTVSETGSAEVAQLIAAFNQMSLGVKRLRDLEREVAHREQLSAIGRVAARVAHDLNNPMTVINSVARLVLKRQDIDGSLTEDMQRILHHCERSITTIEALLSYGRPVALRRREVNLPELVADIGRGWRVHHPRIGLELPIVEPPLVVSVDPYRIEQVLDNLLDNAGAAGRHIRLSVGEADGRCFIRVIDDGPGFSAEARDHLFEPFFTTKTGGTGLGLASSVAIVRAHGGDLSLSDTIPNMVTVWLPKREP